MSSQFTAVLLMSAPWALDADGLAAQMRRMFPQIGAVEALPALDDNPASALLSIEGGNIIVQTVAQPYDHAALYPPLKTLRIWDPAKTIASHRAHVVVSCGSGTMGGGSGVDDCKAFAAATHLVAAAVCALAPVTAVFWEPGYALTRPKDFTEATSLLLAGQMPLGAWLTYASIVPKGYRPEDATGMVTYGMKVFIGRELELAPQRGDAKSAYRYVSATARQILDAGLELFDHQTVIANGTRLSVRARTYWLRRDMSAFVLLTDQSVVDHDTLKPVAREPA